MKRTVALVCALLMVLAVLPAMSFAAPAEPRVEHEDVNFFMTDLDYTSVTSVEDGGTGLHATSSQRYTYLGISENSGMYSCQYLINYPDEFVTITNQSNSWSGGLIAQTLAQIDEDEQTSDNFDSVCNLTYEGQTGGKPVGEEGEIYINGGVYLKTFDFGGVQLGGNFHRFTVRLDKTPFQSECEHDDGGYYLPIALEMLEFTYGIYNDAGVLQASVNYCKPENIGEAPWLSWTDGKLYVNAKEDPVPATPEPTEAPEPTEEPGDHGPVNFFMTDMDYTSVTAVDQGGTGLHATTAQRYTYLGISENSGMYSCQYLINYPDEFVTITNQSNSWSGGLIAQTLAQIDNDEQTSDNFDSVCNLTYEGQTGGKPVGDEGEIYINGGVYLKTFDFGGVQLGGNFHRFTVRLDVAPTEDQCLVDEVGYYLPIYLEMLEFTYGIYNDNGVLQASINWCKPENIENAPWLSWTDGKIYVTPIEGVEPTAVPTEEPTPAPTEVPTYTVYFYVDGNEYTSVTYSYGETYEMPVYIPATGYEFSGWTLGEDGNYYGTTSAIDYTVTYMVGDEVVGTQTYHYGDVIDPIDYTAPDGYTFDGWQDVPETMPAEDIVIYGTITVIPTPEPTEEPTPEPTEEPTPAPTEVPNYTVTVLYLRYSEALEDWVALENPAYVTLPYGAEYDVNDMIPEVIGEYELVEVIGDVTGVVEGNITIEAHYAIPEVPTYTATFVVGNDVIAVQTYEAGATVVAPEYVVPEGYTFEWVDMPETMPAEDITVHGVLTPINYTITIYYLRYSEALEDWVALQSPAYVTVPYGALYDVNDQIPEMIGDYELVEIIGDVTGNVTGNITIEAHYAIPYQPVPPTVTGTRAELRARATEDAMKDLRFVYTVTFNDSYVVYNGTTYGPTTEYYKITKFWSVLSVGANSVTVNGNSIFEMGEAEFTFTACLKGVKEANFATAVTATPYLTYEMNGEATTVTGDPVVASVNDCLN